MKIEEGKIYTDKCKERQWTVLLVRFGKVVYECNGALYVMKECDTGHWVEVKPKVSKFIYMTKYNDQKVLTWWPHCSPTMEEAVTSRGETLRNGYAATEIKEIIFDVS